MTLFARTGPQRSALAARARPSTLRRMWCLLRRPGACGSRSQPRLRVSVLLDDGLGPDRRHIPNPRDRIEQIVVKSHRERPVLVVEERLHQIDVPALVIALQQTLADRTAPPQTPAPSGGYVRASELGPRPR